MNDCYGVIYCITNTIKNKCYIGQHINSAKYSLEDRMSSHKSPSSGCSYLRNSIQHHGWENFTHSIIHCCTDGGQERLDELERYFIKENNTLCPSGYNLTEGGRSGGVLCDASKQKMSETMKKYYEDNPDQLVRVSQNTIKYFKNPENRQKQSDIAKKYMENNPDVVKKFCEMIKGFWSSPEARQRQSDAMKRYLKNNPDDLQKMQKQSREYWANPESSQKLSEMKTKFYQNHENRNKQSESQKKYLENNPPQRNIRVYQYSRDGKTFIKEWISMAVAQRSLNISGICGVCKGNHKTSGGFVWKYTRV